MESAQPRMNTDEHRVHQHRSFGGRTLLVTTRFAQRAPSARRRQVRKRLLTPFRQLALARAGGSRDPGNKQRIELPLFVSGISWPSWRRPQAGTAGRAVTQPFSVVDASFKKKERERHIGER